MTDFFRSVYAGKESLGTMRDLQLGRGLTGPSSKN